MCDFLKRYKQLPEIKESNLSEEIKQGVMQLVIDDALDNASYLYNEIIKLYALFLRYIFDKEHQQYRMMNSLSSAINMFDDGEFSFKDYLLICRILEDAGENIADPFVRALELLETYYCYPDMTLFPEKCPKCLSVERIFVKDYLHELYLSRAYSSEALTHIWGYGSDVKMKPELYAYRGMPEDMHGLSVVGSMSNMRKRVLLKDIVERMDGIYLDASNFPWKEYLLRISEAVVERKNPGVLCIDNLHAIYEDESDHKVKKTKTGKFVKEYTSVLHELKNLAESTDTPIVVDMRMNWYLSEHYDSHEAIRLPLIDDLKYADVVKAVADHVMLLFSERYYRPFEAFDEDYLCTYDLRTGKKDFFNLDWDEGKKRYKRIVM